MNYLKALYAKFGFVWTMILGAAAILVIILGFEYAGNGVGYLRDHVRWWWQDRGDAISERKIAEQDAIIQEKQKEIDALSVEIQRTRDERDALKKSLGDITGQGVQIERDLAEHRQSLERIQSDGGNADVDADDLYERLRQTYPKARRTSRSMRPSPAGGR